MRWLAIVQSIYFVLTGIWPILHIRSFMMVTGPKNDLWLVRTVGALIVVIGGVIGIAGARDAVNVEIVVLAIGSAAALTAVDLIYSLNGTISKIYLLDATAELILIALWLSVWLVR